MRALKKAIIIKGSIVLAAITAVILVVAIVAAAISEVISVISMDSAYHTKKHEEEEEKNIEMLDFFNITGSCSGDSYTLNFDFGDWSINGIKLKLAGDKGSAATTVQIPVRTSSTGAQGAVDWAMKIASDDSFTYGIKPITNAPGCYFCGTNCGPNKFNKPKGYEKTYVCMTFVTAAYAHGANDSEVLSVCKRGSTLHSHDGLFNQVSCFKKIGLMKDLKVSDLEPGDIFVHYASDDGSGHMSMYAGDGRMIDAAGGGFTANSIALRNRGSAETYLRWTWNAESNKNFVMRYTGGNTHNINSSDWNLILVNNHYAIPDGYTVTTKEVGGYEVDSRIADALSSMLSDCRAAGYSPEIISGYRTRETQQYLYDHTANKQDTAVPGHSEHECGLAVDILEEGWGSDWDNAEKTAKTGTQKWLTEHCQDYGFILRYPKDKEDITEIVYESWHYRYVGVKHAKRIMNKGICLEEYLGKTQGGTASLVIDFERSCDEFIFSGSLNGVDIAGSFEGNGEVIEGRGEYGLSASAGAFGISNPFRKSAFTITSLACCNRIHPVLGVSMFHDGWDLAVGGEGTPIYAVCSGTITYAGSLGDYGNHVVIMKNKTEDMYILYGHMCEMNVSVGQSVKSGDQIGKQGSEGRSTGPHLHLEFRKSAQNGLSTANLKGIKPMLQRYANNYKYMKEYFSSIER